MVYTSISKKCVYHCFFQSEFDALPFGFQHIENHHFRILIGKSSLQMAILNSKLFNYQRLPSPSRANRAGWLDGATASPKDDGDCHAHQE